MSTQDPEALAGAELAEAEKRRMVLTPEEFEGLLEIIAAPEAPTEAARAGYARYRALRAGKERGA